MAGDDPWDGEGEGEGRGARSGVRTAISQLRDLKDALDEMANEVASIRSRMDAHEERTRVWRGSVVRTQDQHGARIAQMERHLRVYYQDSAWREGPTGPVGPVGPIGPADLELRTKITELERRYNSAWDRLGGIVLSFTVASGVILLAATVWNTWLR